MRKWNINAKKNKKQYERLTLAEYTENEKQKNFL